MHWIIGKKQTDPRQRPRIDWIATWLQFAPFWLCVGIAGLAFIFIR